MYVAMVAVIKFSPYTYLWLCRQATSRPRDGMLSLGPSVEKEEIILGSSQASHDRAFATESLIG